ncbi:hypothetical protein HH214_18880 [Mucilaginibacter robiniae]|uniref:Uncharacterized protein n=1 Tax=Mucilaginibacter robiniae TaxID=2728022 RepID=A0A7L5E3B0_9SPHI|nr:hypothetical protein [Mucilaginibacter robiniae]QJD97792.1 hypothetical protein HH214_18880 [Mucilaginibacter robiniae]
MREFIVTGGGEIGNAHGTYPFARLTITPFKVQLTISLVGTVIFRPSDTVSIDLHDSFLGIRKGIKIRHKVSGYSDHIIFRPVGNANSLIQHIRDTGFLLNCEPMPETIEQEIASLQSSGSFPIKTSAVVGIVVSWNVLCIPAIIHDAGKHSFFNLPGAMFLPLGLLFLICLCLFFVPLVRRTVLKKHHHFCEIKTGIIFISCIICFLLALLTLLTA